MHSVLLLGQRGSTNIACLERMGVGKSACAFSLKWLYLEYESLISGGLERKSREATSHGISADWEAGARPVLVL